MPSYATTLPVAVAGPPRSSRAPTLRRKIQLLLREYVSEAANLATYPNPVELQFPRIRRRVQIGYAWLTASLAVFASGVLLRIGWLGAMGIFLLIFATVIVGAPALGLRRLRRAIPAAIEVREDRILAERDPRFVRASEPRVFEIPYSRIEGIHPQTRRSLPAVTYIDPIRGRTEVVSTHGLEKGQCRRDLPLTRENLERVSTAYQFWAQAAKAPATQT